MAANLAAVAALLKEHYEKPFTDAMDRDITLLKRIKRGKNVVGREAQWKVHFAGNASAGSYQEEDPLVPAGQQSYMNAATPYRQNWVTVRVTGLAEAATKGAGGFMQALANEMDEALEDLKDAINDQLVAMVLQSPTDIDGLGVIVSDQGVYAGIDRAVNTWWQSAVLANGGVVRPLSLALMQDMLTELRRPARKSKVSIVMCSQEHWYDYGNLFTEYRRFENVQTIDGGLEALKFEGIPVVAIPNMASGSMFFIDERELRYDVLENFKVKEKPFDGDSERFIVTHYSQLVCKHPGRMGRIDDLA